MASVETLDQLGGGWASRLDGREVTSQFVDIPDGVVIGFDDPFAPEESEPGQTGV